MLIMCPHRQTPRTGWETLLGAMALGMRKPGARNDSVSLAGL
jgi:hypothetical protein